MRRQEPIARLRPWPSSSRGGGRKKNTEDKREGRAVRSRYASTLKVADKAILYKESPTSDSQEEEDDEDFFFDLEGETDNETGISRKRVRKSHEPSLAINWTQIKFTAYVRTNKPHTHTNWRRMQKVKWGKKIATNVVKGVVEAIYGI